ncbi:hypothetical protein BAZ12_19220 [Elizabethkingia miricola]|jgi:hypothetical protein|uniref:Uncharacterized protein n=1 Tax=Elizabethkingia miricola TaxID=172045 RepID=A0ABD4DRK1_ELIMR|nr:hypothetical protein ATB95_08505 [Elizabethkingia miricola]OPC76141.1 hypothetical protein BAZ12_19220 [Elizabethkingia miricola]SPW34312.1 Uncharacterised protein [Elizabethkingia miricola]
MSCKEYKSKKINNYIKSSGIGAGHIFLTQINATHIKWEYRSTGGLIDPTQCPNYSDSIKSYIPRTVDLTFTKQ